MFFAERTTTARRFFVCPPGNVILSGLFLILLWHVSGLANVRIRLALSGGPSVSNQFNGQIITNVSGQIRYKTRFQSYYLRIKARATPEFYLNGAESSIFKFNGTVVVGSNLAPTGWQVSFAHRRYFYSSSAFRDFSFEQLSLTGNVWRRRTGQTFWLATLGYWSRVSYSRPGSRLQAAQAQAGIQINFATHRTLSCALQIERFYVSPAYSDQIADRNEGWRAGPVVNLNIRYPFVLNGSLYAAGHYSDLNGKTVPVYGLDLVLGQVFKRKWSLFMLLRWQKLTRLPEGYSPYLAYAPSELENWLALKLSYDLSPSWEIFLRAGWMRENLAELDSPLLNLHGLIGLRWATGKR